MRIGLDVQTLETHERNRGIGKLCLWTIQALLEHEPGVDLVLVGARQTPPDVLPAEVLERVHYVRLKVGVPVSEHLRLGCAADFLWDTPGLEGLDAYHVTSPMMPDILLPVAGRFPVVATLLDGIPAMEQERRGVDAGDWYWTRANVLGTYQRFLPISASAAADCARLLRLPGDRLSVIHVPVRGRADESADPGVARRFGVEAGYVVTVTGYNPRKNIAGTLAAYAGLPRALRERHQLVMVCQLQEAERTEITDLARGLGVADRVVLTGHVTDAELDALVSCADTALFLSHYEGFGIPAAEALAAGVPLVCSNVSSLPEVCGDAALLVDPSDSKAATEALRRALTDEPLRAVLRCTGPVQAARFSPESYARNLVGAYRRCLDGLAIHVPPSPDIEVAGRLRVACFTPLSPRMTGVADYAEDLIEHLPDDVRVDCFVEGGTPTRESTLQRCGVYDASAFGRLDAARRYDVALYQVGNSMHHAYTLPFVTRQPGVATLHDFSLLGLKRELARRLGRRREMMGEFGAEYPDADAAVWETEEQLDRLDFADHPMTGRIIAESRAVVVHSRWMRDQALKHSRPDADVRVIPMGVALSRADAQRASREELRRGFLLSPGGFVVVSIGMINRLKRLDVVLEAFEEFHVEHPDSHFVLMGPADRITLRQLNAFCAARRIRHAVHFLGHRPIGEMYDLIAAADVCVNLRYPSMGETSATLMMILASGRPAIVTPMAQFREFPDDVCLKAPLGSDEKRRLVAHFRDLRADPDAGRRIGANARQFVEGWEWSRVAAMYREVLHQAAAGGS